MMGLEAFAAFFNGAYFIGTMTLCMVGVWVLLLFLFFTGAYESSILSSRTLRAPVAILSTFVFWTGISIFWSISPDLTWTDLNRCLGYLAVFIIGVFFSARNFERNLVSYLFVSLVSAVALYSISVKIFPSVLTNPENLARISVPVGYTNAVGLMMALPVPLAVYFSARGGIHWILRLFSVMTLPFFFIVLFFSLSRGAATALIIGLLMYFTVSPLRLRSLGVMATTLVPVIFVAWWSSAQDPLMKNGVDLALRLVSASSLRIYFGLSLACSMILFCIALYLGAKKRFSYRTVRSVGLMIIISSIIVSVFATFYFINSRNPSFREWAHNEYESYTKKMENDVTGAERLVSMSNYARWHLWREAIENWKENMINGTGAQSFPITHLIYRDEGVTFVKQPHGLPYRLLSELGIIAFVVMGAFIVVSLSISTLLIFGIEDRWQRGLASALLSLIVVYLIHTAYDWDWNIPALTMPYFLFSGMLVGWYGCLKRAGQERTREGKGASGPEIEFAR